MQKRFCPERISEPLSQMFLSSRYHIFLHSTYMVLSWYLHVTISDLGVLYSCKFSEGRQVVISQYSMGVLNMGLLVFIQVSTLLLNSCIVLVMLPNLIAPCFVTSLWWELNELICAELLEECLKTVLLNKHYTSLETLLPPYFHPSNMLHMLTMNF